MRYLRDASHSSSLPPFPRYVKQRAVRRQQVMADEKLREKLADYVEDAHAMEQSVLRSLDSMISTTEDPEIRSMLEHHKEETERHERLLKERLDAQGEGTSTPKEAQTLAAPLLKGIADRARTDKPVKNARDGYV